MLNDLPLATNQRVGGSNPSWRANKHWQKRYYAHKRQCKAICGHKSCEKQDSRSTDIFDTKVDLNPPLQNFSGWNWIFWRNRLWIISHSWEIIHRRFFVFTTLTKKIFRGLEPFSNKIFAVETVQIAHINMQAWAPVSCFSYKMRGNLQAPFFVFRRNSEESNSHQALTGLK